MRTDGWVGDRELDAGVVRALEALGEGLSHKPYVRWVPNPLTELWEFGWEGEYGEDVKGGARAALERHLSLPKKKQSAGRISMLHFIIEGRRPIFLIEGRDPTPRDVEELRRRDWVYRHSFEKAIADLEQSAMGETPEDRDSRILSLADAFANDETLYQMLEFGRKSVLVQGLKKEAAV